MPTTFTISTDDADMLDKILSVIRPGKSVTKAAASNSAAAPSPVPATPLPIPTMAAPAASPTPPAATVSAPEPVAPTTNGGATVSQGAEACNAQMDIFLKQHKAAEAKAILQKYGARRISDVTDVNVLHSIYREFGGQ